MASTSITELISGVLRFFPNAMTVTLATVGLLTTKPAWVLVAIGGILVAIATLTTQYIFTKSMGIGPMPGEAVLAACGIIPVVSGGEYSATPSVWMAMTGYYLAYIFFNAYNIQITNPKRANKNSIPVQQRKGLGVISMLAAVLLFVLLVGARARTSCETWLGIATGLAIGIAVAYGWWSILAACGADVYPDIHGVMIGLKPGTLRTAPMACAPKN